MKLGQFRQATQGLPDNSEMEFEESISGNHHRISRVLISFERRKAERKQRKSKKKGG